MLKALIARARMGSAPTPEVAPGFAGRPSLHFDRCPADCSACVGACPTEAIGPGRLDLGRCLFCRDCVAACPEGVVEFRPDPRMATRRREDLVLTGEDLRLAEALDREALRLFGRSLKLREVSAGGCNGCEVEVAALSNTAFDLGRYGIQFVASPRHADGILVTGPVSANMREALLQTYHAVPAPRLVIATGACAISGGLFRDGHAGVEGLLPVDLYIPGCPPHPLTILDGLLGLLGRR